VATLIGIITSNYDNADYSLFQPLLHADIRDSGRCPPLTRSHLSRHHGHTVRCFYPCFLYSICIIEEVVSLLMKMCKKVQQNSLGQP
jgi:hypothetical protein